MTDAHSLFQQHRPRLFSLAYRMLGTREEAEDAVQEAFTRFLGADRQGVQSAEAYLLRTTAHTCVQRLRALAVRRQSLPRLWLPEPLCSEGEAGQWLERQEHVSLAFLYLLERLGPEERAALLLHDVFGVGYPQLAGALERSEVACRQLVSRARARVREAGRKRPVEDAARRGLLERFAAALQARDEQALLALFLPDAQWMADGGGRVPSGTRPVLGRERIVRLVLGLSQKSLAPWREVRLVRANGEWALLSLREGRPQSLLAVQVQQGRLATCLHVVDDGKLHTFGCHGAGA
jgi:RNA polymerase sigma-70 factor (ECF subfamily)